MPTILETSVFIVFLLLGVVSWLWRRHGIKTEARRARLQLAKGELNHAHSLRDEQAGIVQALVADNGVLDVELRESETAMRDGISRKESMERRLEETKVAHRNEVRLFFITITGNWQGRTSDFSMLRKEITRDTGWEDISRFVFTVK